MTAAHSSNRPALVDAHAHLYDHRVVPYGVFARRDPVFETLVGDYADLPIDGLSHGFDRLYDSYEHIVAAFSEDERDAMFRMTALNWFRVPT